MATYLEDTEHYFEALEHAKMFVDIDIHSNHADLQKYQETLDRLKTFYMVEHYIFLISKLFSYVCIPLSVTFYTN